MEKSAANSTSDDHFFEMWDRENRWVEEPKQQKPTHPPDNRLIEQWTRRGRLVATHKSVKAITSFKPIQDNITKCCDDGGGGEVLLDCKPFRFCYKELVAGDVTQKTHKKSIRDTSNTSDNVSTKPAAHGSESLPGLSATDNIFSMLFP